MTEETKNVVETVEKKPVGRPLKYSGEVHNYIISLFNEVGTVLKTREILTAPNESPLAEKRDKTIVPQPLTISMPCLSNILERAGVKKSGPGRPKVEKTVVATESNLEKQETEEIKPAIEEIVEINPATDETAA